MAITTEQLREIDSKIDNSIEELKLLKQERDIALVHLFAFYEKYVTHDSIVATGNMDDHNFAIKNVQDGVDFAVQWIFKHCKINGSKKSISLQPRLLKQAGTLLNKAMDYSGIWDYMNLIQRNICEAEIDSDNNITLSYKADYRKEADVANRFLNIVDTGSDVENELTTFFENDPYEIIELMKYRIENNILKYATPDEVYVKLCKSNLTSKKYLYELNEDWDLGGYTVKDFRYFFNFLRTLTHIHIQGCMVARSNRFEVNNPNMIKSKNEWLSEITEWINVEKDKCETIFDELIYDYTLYESHDKTPDVTYQPFIQLQNGEFLLVNSLVQQSNFERNHWVLISIIKPELHSKLRNNKENDWRSQLTEFSESIDLEVNGPVSFSFNGFSSNIDFILIDKKIKVILLIELKWLTSPDRIKDIQYLSNELQKGISQIELGLSYSNSQKVEFAEKIGVDKNTINEFNIYGMVMSKNSMGNGKIYKENIPVINERIFKWILSEPHYKNILALWNVGNEQRYLLIENEHYNSKDSNSRFGDYNFVSKGSGMIMLRQFNPVTDFNLEGF